MVKNGLKTNGKKVINFKLISKRALSLVIVIAVGLFLVFIALLGPRPYKGGLQEGEIAKDTYKATTSFYVEGPVDEAATKRLKEQAVDKVRPVYMLDTGRVEEAKGEAATVFSVIETIRNQPDVEEKEKLANLKNKLPVDLKRNYQAVLLEASAENLETAQRSAQKTITAVLTRPVISQELKNDIKREYEELIVVNEATEKESVIKVDDLMTFKDAQLFIIENIKAFNLSDSLTDIAVEITGQIIPDYQNNISYKEELTNQRMQQAIAAVEPVHEPLLVKKGDIIVNKGQLVTNEHMVYLKQLQEAESKNESKLGYYAGMGLFVIILFILYWLYLRLYLPDVYQSTHNITLVGLLAILIIVIAKFIYLSFLSGYLIPLAAVSMLLAILLGAPVAIVTTIFLSIFIQIITGEQLGTFIYFITGGLVGIYSVRNVRRRSQLLKAGLLVGLVNSAVIIAVDLLYNIDYDIMLNESLWGLANGFVCAFVVTGILPILEYMFKITTDISLLELSDLNHPFLKEMVIKAPGTYHHSLIVGNLAESAADSIGANSLLARVGAYYHDIGKLAKPEYFSENQMSFEDQHKELAPKMSSLVITNHVKEGLQLAKKYRLNKAIMDFIIQHHGTSLTFYFYQRALEKEVNEGEIKEEDFRYEGPLPQTKEVAIVLLADSVEAATRAMPNQTPKKIKETVQKIINNKFIDGQLDACDLTLKDLHKISESFSNLLVGIYHSRVEYPEPEEE